MKKTLLGSLFTATAAIALLTPPVGTVLYVLSSTMRVPVGEVFKGSLPFIVPLLVICLAIIFFPGFVTWLPDRLGM